MGVEALGAAHGCPPSCISPRHTIHFVNLAFALGQEDSDGSFLRLFTYLSSELPFPLLYASGAAFTSVLLASAVDQSLHFQRQLVFWLSINRSYYY